MFGVSLSTSIPVVDYGVMCTLAVAFGFFQKLADGHHEHGLYFFRGAGYLFAGIWGFLGAWLISYGAVVAATYGSLLFYWLYKGKIDCDYHGISAIIMIGGLLYGSIELNAAWAVGMLLSYILLDRLKHTLQNPYCTQFFGYKGHFLMVPIIFSLAVHDIFGTVVIFNIVGIWVATMLFGIPKETIGASFMLKK